MGPKGAGSPRPEGQKRTSDLRRYDSSGTNGRPQSNRTVDKLVRPGPFQVAGWVYATRALSPFAVAISRHGGWGRRGPFNLPPELRKGFHGIDVGEHRVIAHRQIEDGLRVLVQ